MISKKLKETPNEVIITMTVATVHGHVPLVGFSKEVEEAWEKLKKRHNLKKCHLSPLEKHASTTNLPEKLTRYHFTNTVSRSSTMTQIGSVRFKFQELEKKEIEDQKDDVYSKSYVPKKYSKMSKEYGTPKPGTLTEMRAKKASKHIAKEMAQICEVIEENGKMDTNGRIWITFGDLFNIYTYISDKVVGILLRARKHHMLDFEGEMLFQRRDEAKIITLLITHDQIKQALTSLK